jgi:hypothetical protein
MAKATKKLSAKSKIKSIKAKNKIDNKLLSLANNVGVTNIKFSNDKTYELKCKEKVDGCKVFNSKCGNKFNNLIELASAIKDMKDEHFQHHVNESKNDFASWAKDCLEEKELAAELLKYKSKQDNELTLLRHIANELGSR